jgi:alpha-L-rhamnosidase
MSALFLAAVALAHASGAPLLGNLQTEGLYAPLAAPPRPRFSWRTGGIQNSYRLTVQEAYPISATLWDSGIVYSNSSWLIPFGGGSLPNDIDALWTVEVDLLGIGLVSASAEFSTAPTQPRAAWLGYADTLRGAVVLDAEPVLRARVHATGVGCYQLFVNGQLVSTELAPGFGHAPSARALYDSFDVSRIVQPGENVVGLRLGSCKWGAFGQYCSGTAAQCNAGIATLVVDQGGNVTTLSTASTWLGANTSVLFQNLWDGELFDARLEQVGWSEPGFSNATAWAPATVVDTSDLIGPLLPSRSPPIDRGAPLKPASVAAVGSPPAFVFDVGANIAGTCGVDLRPPQGEAAAPAGSVVSLLHGELVFGNGSVYNHYLPPGGTHQPKGLNQPQMNYTYVLRGHDELATGPRFAYFGFRFVELRGWPYSTAPSTSAVTCTFLHTLLPTTSAVAFPSNPSLDALQGATLRTHLSNYVTVPTDCPQREKRGWSGDASLSVHSGLLNFDALAFYEAWHASILDQQRIGCLPPGEKSGRVGERDGAPIRPPNWACDPPKVVSNLSLAQYQFGPVSDVVPREQIGMGYFIGDVSWEVAATAIPYELVTQLGDIAYVAANLDGPISLLTFFNALGEANSSSNGLITWSYLGDWVAIDTPNRLLVANVNYVMASLQLSEMASAAGRSSDASLYLALAALLSDSMRGRFWNASASHWDAGSQSAQALCLAFNIGGASVAASTAAALQAAIDAADGHLTVGASGARFLLGVLHDRVSPDAALALALQNTAPSWGEELLNANTSTGTVWESWFAKDVVLGSSLNHIFKAGGISPYIFESALGLRFAMRPATPPDVHAPCPAADACADSLPLNARARLGLDCAHASAVCGAFVALKGVRGGTSLPRIRDEVAARLPAFDARHPARALEARVSLTVSATLAVALGSARGWRATPAGNVSFAWAAHAKAAGGLDALRVEVTAPAAASTKLEIPLRGAARARVRVAATHFEINVERGNVSGAAGAAWATSLCCAGDAAAFVDGRAHGGNHPCEMALLLDVPAGDHVILVDY